MKHTLHITVPYQSVRYCNYCSGAITLTLLATLLTGGIRSIFKPQDQYWWNLCYMESIKLLNGAIQDPTYAVTDTVIMSVLIIAYSTGTVLQLILSSGNG
jgi:hypothetical protein